MTDAIREGLLLLPHDLTAGETAIDAEHSLACRRCSALAALDELRKQLRRAEAGAEWQYEMGKGWKSRADRAEQENRDLREGFAKHRKLCPGRIEFLDGHFEDCPACAALAAAEEPR